ncbi:hypothetical protein [Acaryochloris sp. IP29b_bin.148]|uniref:hypothetical protein n=1 Tax=Acaryochloris sp. IP29b_bin.148 TaxID=2969218 RepID=UPI00260814EE|nr:hypothetical protein [Acaryochloris sp. IP29b_bin.148]
MTTHFITAEVDLEASATDLQASIEAKLQEQGEPLRWAVTDVKADTATVEAVVVQSEATASSS